MTGIRPTPLSGDLLATSGEPSSYVFGNRKSPATMRDREDRDRCGTPANCLPKGLNRGVAQELSKLVTANERAVPLHEVRFKCLRVALPFQPGECCSHDADTDWDWL
jgi:hypothetical protein